MVVVVKERERGGEDIRLCIEGVRLKFSSIENEMTGELFYLKKKII